MASQTPQPVPLDPTLYGLKEDEKAFFKARTGIQDDEELRKHIIQVQTEAYAVYPYSCIRSFAFTSLKISRFPAYQDVLKIGRERRGAVLLDLGCCFGNDARKAIADGFALENVIASDLRPAYWALGHKLFKTTQESFPMAFIAGDVFDSGFLSPSGSPAPTSATPSAPAPSLSTLTSLTPLQHHISVIHASSFFHLFSKPQQFTLAHLLGTLLSHLPGSMILGSHIGLPDTKENREGGTRQNARGEHLFSHSPASWEKMWVGEGGVFQPGDVVLTTKAVEVEKKDIARAGGDPTVKSILLVWSITRSKSRGRQFLSRGAIRRLKLIFSVGAVRGHE